MIRKRLRKFITGALIFLAACAAQTEKIYLKPISYNAIITWNADRHAEALYTFLRSCKKPKSTKNQLSPWINDAAWQEACAAGAALKDRSHEAARRFFETYFIPCILTSDKRTEGTLTGYYIPVMSGSLKKEGPYKHPAHGVPKDLERPYFTREEIANGALDEKGVEVAWFKDPVMPFFMQIQGSGRVKLPNGKFVDLQYADKNGHGYTPIGRTLLDEGVLTRDNISMQSIRQWLYDNPDEAQRVMNTNESYVFFKRADAETLPVGSQGVPLTPERSLAIDHSVLPYGLPVYIETAVHYAQDNTRRFTKLLITQDRGGAIKGPLRGDLFFGQGDKAEVRAGKQNSKGRWIVLIPIRPEKKNE